MNNIIKKFESEFNLLGTPLYHFSIFCMSISKDRHIEIIEEDCEGMYIITIKHNIGNGRKACFSFYSDGEFRTIAD